MYNKLSKRILIIGGSGLIGSSLTKKCKELSLNYKSTYYSNRIYETQEKFDLNDLSEIHKLVKEDDVVIFCSALANPNFVFKNQDQAYDFNVNKTINFINSIKDKINRFIFLSSVEVFDGNKGNYSEKDKKNPLNFYGQTKFEVENFIIGNLRNYTIIRTGWNTSMKFKDRCVIKLTYETLLKDDAKMASDNYFSITNVDDFSSNLLNIIGDLDDNILHLAQNQKISRVQLADIIINKSILKSQMKYQKVKFSEIKFNEPRSRLNDLNTELSQDKYKVNFTDIFKTIEQKIDIIDSNFKE